MKHQLQQEVSELR